MNDTEIFNFNEKRFKSFQLFFLVLVCIDLFMIGDLLFDYADNTPMSHLVVDQIMVLILTVGLALLFPFVLKENKRLSLELFEKNKVLLSTEQERNRLKTGVSTHIEQNCKDWNLTPSETEVCHLLIKGLSQEEIAKIRGTESSTIRQQARSIYRKSHLKGRHELSAYFLEDFLN